MVKDYRNLKLIGSVEEQAKLISLVEQQLNDGWVREREIEANAHSRSGYDYVMFGCSETTSRPAAFLSFLPDENDYLYVVNINPKGTKDLNEDQSNAILEEFLTRFIEPAAEGLDIRIITSPAELNIDNSMSPEMTYLFKQFSGNFAKASHAADEKRFFDFIIQAHNEGALLDEGRLRRLLEDEGWPESQAQEVSARYGFGMGLLKRYDDSSAE